MSHLTDPVFRPLHIAVLTVSDSRSLATDTSGEFLATALTEAGHVLADRALVRDDIWDIRARLCRWIADSRLQAVLITGGTGFTERDNTPQAVMPLLEKTVEGFGELFRQLSLAEIGTSSIQSRALAGISNATLVACMPGSTGACRTAWNGILKQQLDSRTRPCNFVAHLKPGATEAAPVCGPRS